MKTLLIFFSIVTLMHAQERVGKGDFEIEGGLILSMFQQQVKQEVGGETGDPLVNENQVGLMLSGLYSINDFLSVGIFTRFDSGKREAARFSGFDNDGKTIVTNQLGGSYNEFWFGPIVKGKWKQLSLDVGYALVGSRSDDGRTDLPDEEGNDDNSFSVNPSVAWLFALGGNFELVDNLSLSIKLEYRIRYYNERDGKSLVGGVEHGTQSLSPLVGISYSL